MYRNNNIIHQLEWNLSPCPESSCMGMINKEHKLSTQLKSFQIRQSREQIYCGGILRRDQCIVNCPRKKILLLFFSTKQRMEQCLDHTVKEWENQLLYSALFHLLMRAHLMLNFIFLKDPLRKYLLFIPSLLRGPDIN